MKEIGHELSAPNIVDRSSFQEQLDALRIREKAYTHEGDAIAAVRRRLPMVEVDGATTLIGPQSPVTLLDAFEGRRQLIAYYFMWHTGHAAPHQLFEESLKTCVELNDNRGLQWRLTLWPSMWSSARK